MRKLFQSRFVGMLKRCSRIDAIFLIIAFLFLLLLDDPVISPAKSADSSIHRYDVFELSLQGSVYPNTYRDAPSTEVIFAGPDKTIITTPAFWNGGTEWLTRMAPPVDGAWTYSVSSGDAKIDGLTGSFTVRGGMGGLNGHGMVEVDRTHPHKFRYSDGTPFFFMGHSIDWHRQGKLASGQYQQIIQARSQQGFTVLVNYAGPCLGKPIFSSNESGPPFFNNNLDQLNPAHFQEVDERLRIAVDNGLAVTIAMSFADQRIWNLNRAKLERAWKYVMARYAAYPIFWQPIGEYDEGSVTRAREIGQITDAFDPYNHPLSMHSTLTSAEFAGEPWFDFIIHQSGKGQIPITLVRNEYSHNLPIVEEEHRTTDTNLVRKSAWRHFTNGAYYTLTMANYVISDKRTDQLSYLMNFINGISFRDLKPHQELVSRGDCIAKPGIEYIIYFLTGRTVTVDLSATSGTLNIKWFNPRTGKNIAADSILGGASRSFTPPDTNDWVLHITQNKP